VEDKLRNFSVCEHYRESREVYILPADINRDYEEVNYLRAIKRIIGMEPHRGRHTQ